MDKPTKAQEDYAKSISVALKIPLPSMKTKQAYHEFISMYAETFKKAPAAYVVNGDMARGQIVLSFAKIPKNCGDCRLYLDSENYDEDAFFGDGLRKCCPFGASTMNCMNARPLNCPIKKIK